MIASNISPYCAYFLFGLASDMSVPAQEQLRKHDHFMMLSLTHLAQCKIFTVFMTFDLLADYLQIRTSDFHCLVLHWSTSDFNY